MEGQIGFKTDYSLLKSLLKINNIIEFAKEKNYNFVGILDDEPYSIAEFYFKCLDNNIKPIIGIIVNINKYKIYLYIKDFTGYQNIIKIKYLETI